MVTAPYPLPGGYSRHRPCLLLRAAGRLAKARPCLTDMESFHILKDCRFVASLGQPGKELGEPEAVDKLI